MKDEDSTFLENVLYDMVENYFSENKRCEKVGSDKNKPLSLEIFGGRIRPDVFAIKNPSDRKEYAIYMAEGKNSFKGRNFDICKGQGISLQRFADYVYLFFPFRAWRQLDERAKSQVLTECRNLKLGLLFVHKKKKLCKEVIKPTPNNDLLREENKSFARDVIVQYYPDYESPERNRSFFDNYYELARNIIKESHMLMDLCKPAFKILTNTQRGVRHNYPNEEDTYELYLEYKNQSIGAYSYLVLAPFGSEDLETKTPTLFIEEFYAYKQFLKRKMEKQLFNYLRDCVKKKLKVDVYGKGDTGLTDFEPHEDILTEWKKAGFEKFPLESIFVEKSNPTSMIESNRETTILDRFPGPIPASKTEKFDFIWAESTA